MSFADENNPFAESPARRATAQSMYLIHVSSNVLDKIDTIYFSVPVNKINKATIHLRIQQHQYR